MNTNGNVEAHGPSSALSGYFQVVFCKIKERSPETRRQYEIDLRRLDRHLGRPATLGDLTDELVSAVMGSIDKPTVANKFRGHMLAIWTCAAKRRHVEHFPEVAKAKETRKRRKPSRRRQAARPRPQRVANNIAEVAPRLSVPVPPAEAVTLVTLFERFYRVDASLKKSSTEKYRNALRWFRLFLDGREPTTADLTQATIAGLWRFCGERGLSRVTIDRHRRVLGALWRYGSRRGLVETVEELPPVVGRTVERPTPQALPVQGSLEHYYAHVFRPSVVAPLGYVTRTEYAAAVRQFGFFVGGNAPLEQLTEAKLQAFRRWLIDGKIKSERVAYRLMARVGAVVRHAEPSKCRKRHDWKKRPDVETVEGSIEKFFRTAYVNEKELATSTQGFYRDAISQFRRFLEREPMLADFAQDPFNRFLTAAQERRAPATVKGYRRALVALWRCAFERGDVEAEPKRIRRIKAPPPIPDAWTPAELARLVAATYALAPHNAPSAWLFQGSVERKKLGESAPWEVGWYDSDGRKRSKRVGDLDAAERFRQQVEAELIAGPSTDRKGGPRAGIDLGAFLRAVLFAVYDSGFRISDIRALRRDSIDWSTGVVTLRQQKTQLPITRQFRPTTLDAMRVILRDDCETVFYWPWRKETLWRQWRKVLHAAGLPVTPRNGFQKLRRTSATHFARLNGVAEATTHLGHQSGDLARRHYLDPSQAYAPPPLPPPIPLPVALLPAPDGGRGAA